jgi:hypothetical protein
MFSQLDKYLNSNFSTDYWADEAICVAEQILSRFSETDWNELTFAIKQRPSEWVLRCVESLGEINSPFALKALIETAQHSNTEIQIASLDSIRFHVGKNYLKESDIKMLLLKVSGFSTQSSVTAKMIGDLKIKLSII